ncbi:MAG TPA: tRNA (N(6)-L-threonylcarbamoyladenosine(37)-C(2))-methylthiotransferase MtaB, partial [Bacteroidetes bacterium]|nr:tRNA (N(6)-L-threonylcarbamoyladenosine(37)-C(2))-methylthiotransferase MtaB [Bacteroidota bacterium]
DDGRTRTHLKIQDGCDYSCSFCTIPDARGPARAMPFEDVLKTLQDLDGHTEEVVLTGINLGEYRSGTHRFVDVVRGINELRPSYRV